jgi:hypothetical protein
VKKRIAGIPAVAALAWLAIAQRPGRRNGQLKPRMSDTIKASVYVDNWFMMSSREHPMTIAILAKDNADPSVRAVRGTP